MCCPLPGAPSLGLPLMLLPGGLGLPDVDDTPKLVTRADMDEEASVLVRVATDEDEDQEERVPGGTS